MKTLRLLVLLAICASSLHPAHATERAGDAAAAQALQDLTAVVNALEIDILARIETTPDTQRLDAYWTYNALMGAWTQVDLAQALLQLAVSATSWPEEEGIRTTLRDQARFAVWELDEARIQLEQHMGTTGRPEDLEINEAIRRQLSSANTIIGGLLADQCGHVQC